MKEKDLKKLTRQEILELLIEQTKRVNELEEALAKKEAQVTTRTIEMQQAGTLAEAALRMNNVFAAADKAVSQYVENIVRLNRESEEIRANIEATVLADARAQIAQTDEKCRERERAADAYWEGLKARLEEFYAAHQGLREVMGNASLIPEQQPGYEKPIDVSGKTGSTDTKK